MCQLAGVVRRVFFRSHDGGEGFDFTPQLEGLSASEACGEMLIQQRFLIRIVPTESFFLPTPWLSRCCFRVLFF